jgi:hypothetical protein
MAIDTIGKGPVFTPQADSSGMETLNVGKKKGVTLADRKDTNELQVSPGATTTAIDHEQFVMRKNPKTEQGHATPPSAEQKAWDDYNKAKAEWDAKKSAFDNASKGIEAADKGIGKIDEQIRNLQVLFETSQLQGTGGLIPGDKILTWKELVWLSKNGTDEQKAAAQWMMDNKADFYDSMAKGKTLLDVDAAPNFNGEPVGVGLTLQSFVDKRKEMLGYRAQAVAAKPPAVADPGPPPTPPGKPVTTENPSMGQNPPPGATPPPGNAAPPSGGATNPPGSETTPKPPTGDSKTPALDAVPPYNSKATSGEGRLLDAIDNMQARMDALEKDMAAAGDNPALMQRLNAMYTKMNTAMSMFTQLLKQRTEMMNNMQKMYSEMAMSAIRNMR